MYTIITLDEIIDNAVTVFHVQTNEVPRGQKETI